MPGSASAELLERLVTERHSALKDALRQLDLVIALENRDLKIKTAEQCLAALDALCAVLAVKDQPQWVSQLRDGLGHYAKYAARDQEAGRQLLERMRKLKPVVFAQTWGFLGQGNAAVEFASVYDQFYEESRVPELFEQLIDQLQQVIDSRKVDSLRILEALDTLMATVRANSRQDVLAAYGAIGFAKSFLRNFLFAALEEVPGVKPFVKALKDTLDELDAEFASTQSRANDRVAELVASNMPVDFEYRPLALPAAEDNSCIAGGAS